MDKKAPATTLEDAMKNVSIVFADGVKDALLAIETRKAPHAKAIEALETEQAAILSTVTIMSGAGAFVPGEWEFDSPLTKMTRVATKGDNVVPINNRAARRRKK